MDIRIKANHPKTIQFLKYIVKNVAEKENLKPSDEVLISIQNGKTPFPEFEKYNHRLGSDYDALKMTWELDPSYDKKANLIAQYLNENFQKGAIFSIPKREKNKPLTFLVRLVIGEVYEVFRLYQKLKAETLPKKLVVKRKKHNTKDTSKTKLYLNRAGNLWRNPRVKYCYDMVKDSDRYKIVCYLAKHKGFQSTSDISIYLGGKENHRISNDIAKVKENITKYLKIKGSLVIMGKIGSGYKITPEYQIKLVNS